MVELAQKSGVGRDTISRIEHGRADPLGPTLNKLARALGTTVEHLYAMEERHRLLAPAPPLDLVYTARANPEQRRRSLEAGTSAEIREYYRAIDRQLDSLEKWQAGEGGRVEQEQATLAKQVDFYRALRAEAEPFVVLSPAADQRAELGAEASLAAGA